MAFINAESIIKKYNIITKKLLVFKPLYLVDSILTLLITDYFTAWMLIGLYTKAMLFFITKLLPTTLIILGMP
jgi:uncharacterized Fe-S cluster-containing MiaB family protein